MGGASLDQQGLRSSPSVRYLSNAGAFTIEANGRVHGGLFWDGRAATREEQARGPLLNPKEMANASVADFAARLRGTTAWLPLRNAYGLAANSLSHVTSNSGLPSSMRWAGSRAIMSRSRSCSPRSVTSQSTMSCSPRPPRHS